MILSGVLGVPAQSTLLHFSPRHPLLKEGCVRGLWGLRDEGAGESSDTRNEVGGWKAGRRVHWQEEGQRKGEKALNRTHRSSALHPHLLCLAGVFHPVRDADAGEEDSACRGGFPGTLGMQAYPGPYSGHTVGLWTGLVLVKAGDERPSELGVAGTRASSFGFFSLDLNPMYLACPSHEMLSLTMCTLCGQLARVRSGVRQTLFASQLYYVLSV